MNPVAQSSHAAQQTDGQTDDLPRRTRRPGNLVVMLVLSLVALLWWNVAGLASPPPDATTPTPGTAAPAPSNSGPWLPCGC